MTDQQDHTPRNRAERIRKRGWKEAQAGRVDNYSKLVALSLEVNTIKDDE
jgi:hypothetical protein